MFFALVHGLLDARTVDFVGASEGAPWLAICRTPADVISAVDCLSFALVAFRGWSQAPPPPLLLPIIRSCRGRPVKTLLSSLRKWEAALLSKRLKQ